MNPCSPQHQAISTSFYVLSFPVSPSFHSLSFVVRNVYGKILFQQGCKKHMQRSKDLQSSCKRSLRGNNILGSEPKQLTSRLCCCFHTSIWLLVVTTVVAQPTHYSQMHKAKIVRVWFERLMKIGEDAILKAILRASRSKDLFKSIQKFSTLN